MTITYSSQETLYTVATTAWSWTPSTALVADEIIFLTFSVNSTGFTITGPTGGSSWSYPGPTGTTAMTSGSASIVWAWHKVTLAEAGTTPTYDFTGPSSLLNIHAIRLQGVDVTNPVNTFSHRTDGDTTKTTAAMTTTVGNAAIFGGANQQSASAGNVISAPAGWTALQNSSEESAGRAHVLAYKGVQSAADVVPTSDFTATSNLAGHVWQVAFAPEQRSAPVHVATYSTGYSQPGGNTTFGSLAITCAVGDVLVVKASAENATGNPVGTPTDTLGNTYTLKASANAAGGSTVAPCYIWTTVVTTGGSGTLTITKTGTDNLWRGVVVHRWSNTDGVGAGNSDNNGTGSGTPSTTLTTTSTYSAIDTIAVDWNAVDGASRTWLTVNGTTPTAGNGFELTYARNASFGTAYGAYWPVVGTATTYTVGLSAPTGQRFSMAAVEVLGKNAAGPSNTVHRWVGGVTTSRLRFGVKTSGAAAVRVGVSTVSDMSSGVVYSTSATPSTEGWTKHEITGLSAGTTYYYAVERDGSLDTGSILSTKTYPSTNSFKFTHASCLQNNSATSAIFTQMDSFNPNFFLHLGDWHYDDNSTATVASQEESIASQIVANSSLGSFIAKIPTMYETSDHDAGANNFSPGPQTHTPFLRTAYVNMVPSYDLPNANGLYQSFVIGRVRFIMCDTRSFRSSNAATDNSSKTMLGATQKSWLFSELSQAEPVKVITFDCAWVGAAVAGEDDWTGFTTERAEIANYITTNNIRAVIIHGDAHCLAADDGTNSAGGIPVFAAAPLSQTSSIKGGPYSEGTYPLSGALGGTEHLASLVTVTDTPSNILLSFNGIDDTGTSRITLDVNFALGGQLSYGRLKIWNGSQWITYRNKYYTGSVFDVANPKGYV